MTNHIKGWRVSSITCHGLGFGFILGSFCQDNPFIGILFLFLGSVLVAASYFLEWRQK